MCLPACFKGRASSFPPVTPHDEVRLVGKIPAEPGIERLIRLSVGYLLTQDPPGESPDASLRARGTIYANAAKRHCANFLTSSSFPPVTPHDEVRLVGKIRAEPRDA